MRVLTTALAFILISVPTIAMADGLVPCGDPGQPACQTCHFYELVQNIFRWVFGLAATVVTIIIVLGGLRLVTSAGNAVAKKEARKIISAAIIGFILVGCSWFIVEFTLRALAGYADSNSVWSSLQCVAQPNPQEVIPTTSTAPPTDTSTSGAGGAGTSGGGSGGGGGGGW